MLFNVYKCKQQEYNITMKQTKKVKYNNNPIVAAIRGDFRTDEDIEGLDETFKLSRVITVHEEINCLQCYKKLPKAYVQMDFKKFCSMKCMEKYYDKWEMMINRMKAVEARVKRLEEESESVKYIVSPPKNNGLVKEKNESFIKRLLNNIKALKP